MTPAEREQWLLKQASERYVDQRLRLGKYMMQGGQTPGVQYPSRAELIKFFENTNPGYWQTLKVSDPEEAQSQLEQWKAVQ